MLLYFTCNFYQYGVHVWVIYLLLHNFQCRRLECISVAPPAQLMRVLIKMCPVQWTALFYGGKTWPTDCSWLYTWCNFHSEGENIVGVNITTALHIEGQFSMYSFPDSAVQGRDSLGMRLANNCVLIFCLVYGISYIQVPLEVNVTVGKTWATLLPVQWKHDNN